MRFSIHNGSVEQLQKKYRRLLQESERLSGINEDLSNAYYADACKVLNKLSLIRRQGQF
ncbi:MAG: Lacal_2735 family protein [Bacteroidales bacterium]|nr:Lacal_2735 family protein [Bacteroidales bacterium]